MTVYNSEKEWKAAVRAWKQEWKEWIKKYGIRFGCSHYCTHETPVPQHPPREISGGIKKPFGTVLVWKSMYSDSDYWMICVHCGRAKLFDSTPAYFD